jgi:hypothetical protein
MLTVEAVLDADEDDTELLPILGGVWATLVRPYLLLQLVVVGGEYERTALKGQHWAVGNRLNAPKWSADWG